MEWNDSLLLRHQHWDDPNYFPETYPDDVEDACPPSTVERKETGGNEIQGDGAEDALTPHQNQQDPMPSTLHEVGSSDRKENLNTPSKRSNAKKKMADQKYRKKQREEKENMQQEIKNLREAGERSVEKIADLQNEIKQLKSGNNDPPKSSLSACKAKFKVNFHDDESKKCVMRLIHTVLYNEDVHIDAHLKKKKGLLKLKGIFNAEAMLNMLNKDCDTRLVSKVNALSMTGPSTGAKSKL